MGKLSRSLVLGLALLLVSPFSLAKEEAKLDAGLKKLDAGDFKAAAEIFAKSFEAGEVEGGFYLGRMFELGVGTEPNIQRAASIYTAAAEKGSLKSANRLAMLYLEGKGVLQDYSKAAELLKKGAVGGDKDAQYNFGVLVEKGWGVKKSAKNALTWFKKAAEQDHIAAQNTVALMYKEGREEIKASDKDAAIWFGRSANQGNALGLFHLGEYVEKGLVGEKADPGKAYMMFNLAAAGGHPDAPKKRDALAKELDSDALIKAQQRARKWLEASAEKREKLL